MTRAKRRSCARARSALLATERSDWAGSWASPDGATAMAAAAARGGEGAREGRPSPRRQTGEAGRRRRERGRWGARDSAEASMGPQAGPVEGHSLPLQSRL